MNKLFLVALCAIALSQLAAAQSGTFLNTLNYAYDLMEFLGGFGGQGGGGFGMNAGFGGKFVWKSKLLYLHRDNVISTISL